MTQCPFCKGAIEQRRIEHVHRWAGEIFVLRDVPAEVCNQCGEVFFGPDVLKNMDEIATRKRDPDEHIRVPVFSLR